MGNVAFLIGENGVKTFRIAGKLKPEDYDDELFCGGWIEEEREVCGVPVSVVSASERRNEHFRRRPGAPPHRNGCPFDEKRKKITVENLDRSGKGKTTQDIFNQLNKDKKKRSNPPKGGNHLPEGEIAANTGNEEHEEEEREIRTRKRLPQTLQELLMVLKSLSITDYYADRRVFDQILDERTIAAYRRMRIPEGLPFVITARKTLPYLYIQNLENNQWVVVDYWTKSPNSYAPLVFVLTVTDAAKMKLNNICQHDPAAKIHVYAKFKKHPSLQNTYISELVKAHMICASFDDVD